MSELRKDVFTGRWVVVNQSDAVRPTDFQFRKFTRDTTYCAFCETNEAATLPEIFAIRPAETVPNTPGWRVRVVPNRQLRLRIEGDLGRRGEGVHDVMNGIGADEVIAETPRHDRSLHELSVPEIADVLRTYVNRITDLYRDPRIRYVLVYKNHGEEAGALTSTHSLSLLMGIPITPAAVKVKLVAAREYYSRKERCVYCDAMQQDLDDQKRIVEENEKFVVVAPFASYRPFQMRIVPKRHSSTFTEIDSGEIHSLAQIMRNVLQKLDYTLGSPPYNMCLFDRPAMRQKEGYWDTIEHDFHWHFEILPRVTRISGFEISSGFFCNPVLPELVARCLSPASDLITSAAL